MPYGLLQVIQILFNYQAYRYGHLLSRSKVLNQNCLQLSLIRWYRRTVILVLFLESSVELFGKRQITVVVMRGKRHKKELFSECEWECEGNKLHVEVALKKIKIKLQHVLFSIWSHSTAAASLARHAAVSLQHSLRTWHCLVCQDQQQHSAAETYEARAEWCQHFIMLQSFYPNRRILHWTALCSVLFTNLHLWLPVFEELISLALWLFRDVACSWSYALMYYILTVASKLKWIGLQRVVDSDYNFRWMRMREGSQVS